MPADNTQSPPASRTISTTAARLVLGISEPTFNALRQRPDFPRPIRYSAKGRLLWVEAELLAWQESMREQRGGDPHAA